MNLREIVKKSLFLGLPVLSALFLIGSTAIIILLMKGYSIDITKRELIKTGVLNLETIPADADITIDGVNYGRTNKAIPNLRIGDYLVEIKKDGYYTYTRSLPVNHGLATPLTVPLLRKTEPKIIVNAADYISYQVYTDGFFTLAQNKAATPTASVTTSPVPTPTVVPDSATISYMFTNITITKPFFDDPQPVLDERMTVTTTAGNPITEYTVSPTGKYILVTTKNAKTNIRSLSLVPFKKGTSVSLTLTENKTLTFYAQEKDSTIVWSEDGDYVIIETKQQIISYNVTSGTKLILYEKGENGQNKLVWNQTQTGIVIVRQVQGSQTATYEIVTISNNSTPVDSQIPLLSITEPTAIWSFTTTKTPSPSFYVIATKKGSYLLGKIYTQKIGEFDVTLQSSDIAGSTISQLKDDYSLVSLTSDEIKEQPLYLPLKNGIAFVTPDKKALSLFTFNKRSSDTLTTLGKSTVYTANTEMSLVSAFSSDFYIGFTQDGVFSGIDLLGKNMYTLAAAYGNSRFDQNDTALLLADKSGNILFKVLR